MQSGLLARIEMLTEEQLYSHHNEEGASGLRQRTPAKLQLLNPTRRCQSLTGARVFSSPASSLYRYLRIISTERIILLDTLIHHSKKGKRNKASLEATVYSYLSLGENSFNGIFTQPAPMGSFNTWGRSR